MSPDAALRDPIFRRYLVIVAALLLGAGLVLALLQVLLRKDLRPVWKTYASWLWMAPLAATFIFAGRVVFIAGVAALAALGLHEFARATGLARERWMMAALFASVIAIVMASILPSVFGPVLLLAVAMIAFSGPCLSLGWLAFLLLGLMFGQLGALANFNHAYGYLCFLLLATELNDVVAFTSGKMFGRRLLWPRVSPRKTWEGSLGAVVFSLFLPWLLRFSFPFFGARELILAGLIVGIGGQLGDLAFSALKRKFEIKDWGDAIPGHGGVLDRMDSLVFVAPLFSLLAGYYHPGG